MTGGMGGQNVFALQFLGSNISKESIELKSADITSLIDGTRLALEIVGNDQSGASKLVGIQQVQLIPPGARVELIAKFGPIDPNAPEKVLGLDPKSFLEKWRQFSFKATDERRIVAFDFNENAFMPFFQGQVGPRVVIKPAAP